MPIGCTLVPTTVIKSYMNYESKGDLANGEQSYL